MPTRTTLIAPLNWGLGHATRCVPIIKRCVESGERVVIAANGAALVFLRQEFPNIETVKLSGYNMRYACGKMLPLTITLQMPLFGISILIEHIITIRLSRKYKVDRIISDNRYGVWNNNIESIIITHQPYIQLPKHLSIFCKPLHTITARLLSKFNHIWVPDYADVSQSLSGALSHGGAIDRQLEYIGPLSRFTAAQIINFDIQIPDLLVVLSGPGRQKFKLARQIVKHFQTDKKIVILGASPGKNVNKAEGNINYINHLPTKEFQYLLQHTPHIISFAGYTTIMDLHVLDQQAKLVPTAGQWEQEYLIKWRCCQSANL